MPYLKRTVKAGKTIEIKKYFSVRYGSRDRSDRKTKEKASTEQQKRVNENNAIEKLTWLLNENFKPGDMHIVLTYSEDKLPTADESKIIMQKFLRKLKNEYRKENKELKYVWVTEYHNTRLHHHLIVNSFDIRKIQKIWSGGIVRSTLLYDDCEYSALAIYLVKETRKTFALDGVFGKRWNASKNLKKPKITKTIVPADSWKDEPQALKGYYIVRELTVTGVDEAGFPYQKYTMVQIPNFEKIKNSERKENTHE